MDNPPLILTSGRAGKLAILDHNFLSEEECPEILVSHRLFYQQPSVPSVQDND